MIYEANLTELTNFSDVTGEFYDFYRDFGVFEGYFHYTQYLDKFLDAAGETTRDAEAVAAIKCCMDAGTNEIDSDDVDDTLNDIAFMRNMSVLTKQKLMVADFSTGSGVYALTPLGAVEVIGLCPNAFSQERMVFNGGGNAAPSIPSSQRQYDGDNPYDYCEEYEDF